MRVPKYYRNTNRVKLPSFSILLFLLGLFLSEQMMFPVLPVDSGNPGIEGNASSQYYQQALFSSHYILSSGKLTEAPAPAPTGSFIKWRCLPADKSFTTLYGIRSHPETVQDIWRCPTVSFVLFPFHEFL